jgi:hypothetical protein
MRKRFGLLNLPIGRQVFANQKINWRAFLAQFVKQYLLNFELFTPSAGAARCLVVLIPQLDIF